MKNSIYKWKKQPEVDLPETYVSHLTENNISPLIGQILWHRGIQDAAALATFLTPTLEQLHDPMRFFDMDKAVTRIQQAIAEGEQILIYGDYDADGITSTTVMKEAIELLGGQATYFLPNRFIHGYGPNQQLFAEYIDAGTQLIITVDNGVAGHEALAYAKSAGVDVIVTDHHELPPELPETFALIHPRHPKGDYPFGDLAGVGVAFKVATALLGDIPLECLDLVAIGTIADLVSLTGENRALVQLGLQMMKTSDRIGLASLFKVAGVDQTTANEETIGFMIGPRLNALGRLGEAGPGVELLSTFDEEVAADIAQEVNQQNDMRKKIVQTITEEALALLNPDDSVHLLAKSGWHEGVLGIVAGKIMQQTQKPTIVLTIDETAGTAKGSGRSISSFNLYEALNQQRILFTHFGGHHMAAGMTLPVTNIEPIKAHLTACWEKQNEEQPLEQELMIDETLPIAEVSLAFIEQLRILAPFGTDNPVPNFLFEQVATQQVKRIGADQTHLKGTLQQATASLDFVAFQMGALLEEVAETELSVVGQLGINEWNNHKKPQLIVTDFAVKDAQLFDLRGAKKLPNFDLTQTAFLYSDIQNCNSLPEGALTVALTEKETWASVRENKNIVQVVIVDCPPALADLETFLHEMAYQRVYVWAHTSEQAYLNGLGTREQFARLYQLIKQQQTLDVRYKSKEIAQYLNLPDKLLIFMIQVFFELGFVTIEDGVLKNVPQPSNRPLTESATYQKRMQQIKVEEFLLYSSRQTLKTWLWPEEEL